MADVNKHITYSLADIQRYLQGDMSAKEMHDIEWSALADPFLADALEGYSEANLQQAQQHLAQIDTAIRQEPQKGKIIALPPVTKQRVWLVAASIILLIGIAGISYLIFTKKDNDLPLAKAENSGAALATDSAPMRLQTIIPQIRDTATIANKERVADKKKSSPLVITPKNKSKALRKPAAQLPVPVTAKRIKSDTATLNTSGTMALQVPANTTAKRLADTQQSPVPVKEPSSDNEWVNTIMPATKDSNNESLKDSTDPILKAPGNEIAGTIVDNFHQPVPNAMISLQDGKQHAITDAHGHFKILTYDSTAIADITALGYEPQKQQLQKGKNNVVLKVNESGDLLSVGVITTSN